MSYYLKEFIIDYQWELFIFAEIISWLSLVLFLLIRYAFRRFSISILFLMSFLVATIFEVVLAIFDYQETGEIATFQIIIFVFILYAFTFGIGDFKKIDRYLKIKIGKWQGKDLLTEKDKHMMKQNKDPAYIARKYRRTWAAHAVIFMVVHLLFWTFNRLPDESFLAFFTQFSWITESEVFREPFVNQISAIWKIIFFVDTIWSWSYTLFPAKPSQHKEKGE